MEMLPLERRIWRGGARSATAPTYGERRLGLRGPLATRATAAMAATAVATARIAATGLEVAARLATGALATFALPLARLAAGLAARLALSVGARIAARRLPPPPLPPRPPARAARAARAAHRLGVLRHDRHFLAQAFGQRHLVERDLGQPLDVAQVIALVLGAEADRHALAPGARGATDAVDVLLGHIGQLEVDDVAHAGDVDPACRDVGRDEHADAAGLEVTQCSFALGLALVAVNRVGRNVALRELLHHPVGAVLGAGEDQHAVHLVRLQALAQRHREQRLLFALRDEADVLVDALGGSRLRRDRDLRRIGQVLARELLDRVRH